MITLHHLENSRSHRITWLLEELNLPYEVKIYKRNTLTLMAPVELKEIHPLGKSPVLTDDKKKIAESGAIILYILRRYDLEHKFYPKLNDEKYDEFEYWMHYAEGSFMPFMVLALVFAKVLAAPVPFFIKPIVKKIVSQVKKSFIDPNIKTHLKFMEEHLKIHQWFLGDQFSAADIHLSYSLEAAQSRAGFADYPSLARFLKAIHERTAYQRASLRTGGLDFKAFL
jgi:glutathione S-transferase